MSSNQLWGRIFQIATDADLERIIVKIRANKRFDFDEYLELLQAIMTNTDREEATTLFAAVNVYDSNHGGDHLTRALQKMQARSPHQMGPAPRPIGPFPNWGATGTRRAGPGMHASDHY